MRILSLAALASVVLAALAPGCSSSESSGPAPADQADAAGDQPSASTDAPPDGTAVDDASAETGEVGPAKVGSPCTDSSQCPAGGSGTAACNLEWPGGYCEVVGCADHGHDCPDDPGLGGASTVGSQCVLSPGAACLALCATTADCRDGYECAPRDDAASHAATKVCVPVS